MPLNRGELTKQNGSFLEPGDKLFVGLRFRDGPMMSHLRVWVACTDSSVHCNIIPEQLYGDYSLLIFHNEQDCKDFNEWWTRYAARFGSSDRALETQFPGAIAGQEIKGTVINTKNHIGTIEAQWEFIVKNCYETVLFFKNFWLFESPAEACIFELKFASGYDKNEDPAHADSDWYEVDEEEDEVDLPF